MVPKVVKEVADDKALLVTIPKYKVEEHDDYKDSVSIFLCNWGDIHCLQGTPDHARAIEMSLSLKGKAYKWWTMFSLTRQRHGMSFRKFFKRNSCMSTNRQ